MDVLRDAPVVERERSLLLEQESAAPAARFLSLQSLAKRAVGGEKHTRRAGAIRDEPFLDEHIARADRIDRPERDAAFRHQHELSEARALPRGDLAGFLDEMRLELALLAKVRRDADDPVGLDPRADPRKPARGLDHFRGDDPVRRAARERAGRMHREERAHRRAVLALLRLQADLRGESREHRPMESAVVDLRAGLADLDREVLRAQLLELPDDIRPLAHALVGQHVLLAPLALLARAEFLPLLLPFGEPRLAAPRAPDAQIRREIARRVGEPRVHEVRGVALQLGADARILDGERRRDHEDVVHAALVDRREKHARKPRIERKNAHRLAELRQATFHRRRAELDERRAAIGDEPGGRRIDEREVLGLAEVQRLHLENDAREVRAQDLRLGELGAALEVLLGIQANRDARAKPPRAPCALPRACLRDLLDRQARHARLRAVAKDAREPRVDHRVDPRHGQRCLGDIRRKHDAPERAGREDPLLFLERLPREERKDLGARLAALARLRMAAEVLGGLADLAFARQEHEDIRQDAVRREGLVDLVDRARDRIEDAGILLVEVAALRRAIAGVDRIGAPGNLDDGRAAEMRRKPRDIDGRAREDHLEVGSPREKPSQVAEQEVDVEAALVRLVDDDGVVRVEPCVAARLREQHAVGQHLDERVASRFVAETHLHADDSARLHAEFLSDAPRDAARGDAAWLRVADAAEHAAPELEAELRQLRALAGARLARDDHDLVRGDRIAERVDRRRHRKLGRIGHRRHEHAPPRKLLGAPADCLVHRLERALVGDARVAKPLLEPTDPGTELPSLRRHHAFELPDQVLEEVGKKRHRTPTIAETAPKRLKSLPSFGRTAVCVRIVPRAFCAIALAKASTLLAESSQGLGEASLAHPARRQKHKRPRSGALR